MTDLRDAHVLVVGATGGLGSAIARQLAASGARVSLSGRRAEALDRLATELGPAVLATAVADLTRPGSAQDIVDQVTAGQPPLAGVVYAAGVVAFGPAVELDDDVMDELLLVNFIGAVRMVRAAVPALATGGFLAHLSAVVAEQPTAGMAAYSATKAALTAFDAAVGGELRRQGIRVIDVRPPHTETGLAGRPISGAAPRLRTGLDPVDVAARVVRAIQEDGRSVSASEFGAG